MIPPPSIEQLITSQDSAQIGMAGHLESLAAHYDQMCNALREREAGDVFGEDDLQGTVYQNLPIYRVNFIKT